MAFTKNENLAQEICTINYALVSEILSVNVGTTPYRRSVTFLTFPSGNAWKTIYFTPGTALFSEKEKIAAAGNYFAQELVCFYPGEDEDNIEDFDAILNVPIIMYYIYNNGQIKLFGDLDNPVKLIKNLDVGKKTGRQLSFVRGGDVCYWFE